MSVAISVVVPVYNASRYLGQCIDSLINQSFTDVEFIFVDDGSTDDSVEIIRGYQKRDNRIILLQQGNLHAGVARNNGMRQATGKYIIFLDSDDFFDLNMLKEVYDCAEKNQVEVVLFGYRKYDDVQHKVTSHNLRQGLYFPKGVFSAADLGDRVYSLINPAPWNKLFLKSFVDTHHLQFDALKKCNDAFFTYMAIAWAERMFFIDKRYVNYRINNQSSLQGARNKDRKTYIDVGMSVKKGLINAGKYTGDLRKAAIQYAQHVVGMGIIPPYTRDALEDYYLYAKKHLIPDLFDSPSDFDKCYTVKNIYESSDFCDFLWKQLQSEKKDKNENYVSISRYEARIGRTLLSIPKKILGIVKKY